MPLTSLVTVVLRLFSFSWLVQGLASFVSVLGAMAAYPSTFPNYWHYAAPVLLVLAAIGAFLFSGPLARILTPPPNPTVNLGGLSQYDLYCFAFTFLGLYFALSSIGNSLNWLHYYLLLTRDTSASDPMRQTSFYDLTQPLITLFAGGACLLFAPLWARKLSKLQRGNEAPDAPPSQPK